MKELESNGYFELAKGNLVLTPKNASLSTYGIQQKNVTPDYMKPLSVAIESDVLKL